MSFIAEIHANKICEEFKHFATKNFYYYKWKVSYTHIGDHPCFLVKCYSERAKEALNFVIPIEEAQEYFHKWATPHARLKMEAKILLKEIFEVSCKKIINESNSELH